MSKKFGNLLSFRLVVIFRWIVASSPQDNTGHIQKRETSESAISSAVFETDTKSFQLWTIHSSITGPILAGQSQNYPHLL